MRAAPAEFAGKVAIVTGGGGGLGYAIARAFARNGARVVIAGRTQETLARAAAAIEKECGAPVLPVAADVAEPPDCERMVAAAVDRFGAVDILVNNAAYFAASAADRRRRRPRRRASSPSTPSDR